MKKLIIILVGLLYFTSSLKAQTTSNIKTYKTEDLGLYYVVSNDLLWSANQKGLKCWNTLTSTKVAEIPYTNLVKESIPVKLIAFQNKILFFYKEWNKTEKKFQLFYNQVSGDGSSTKVESKLVGYVFQYLEKPPGWETKYIGYPLPGTALSVEYYFKNIEFNKSSDDNLLFISNAGINLFVFNKEMQMEYKISAEKTAIKAEDFASMGFGSYESGISNNDNFITLLDGEMHTVLATHVDTKGTSYALKKVYTNGKNEEATKKEKNTPNYHLELVTTEKGKNKDKQKIKNLDNNFITNIKFFESKNGKIWLVGMYNDFPSPGSSLGIITIDIETVTAKFSPHSIDYVTTYLRAKKTPKKNNIPLRSFQIYDNEAGGILVMGQKFINDFSNGYLLYGTFAPIMIDAKHNVEWLKILHKGSSFSGLDLGCGNYSYAYLKNKHYFFYIDNEKNSASDLSKDLVGCKNCDNGYLRAFVIDNKGEINKKNIFDVRSISKSVGKSFYTHHIQKISEDEIIFEMLKSKKEAALVKLKIK